MKCKSSDIVSFETGPERGVNIRHHKHLERGGYGDKHLFTPLRYTSGLPQEK